MRLLRLFKVCVPFHASFNYTIDRSICHGGIIHQPRWSTLSYCRLRDRYKFAFEELCLYPRSEKAELSRDNFLKRRLWVRDHNATVRSVNLVHSIARRLHRTSGLLICLKLRIRGFEDFIYDAGILSDIISSRNHFLIPNISDNRD